MLDAGNFTTLTGRTDINDIQKVVRWRGLTTAPYWRTPYGCMLNGTDGSRAPPFTRREDRVYMFVPQLCRSLYVTYQQDVTVAKLIPALQVGKMEIVRFIISLSPLL